MSERQPGARHQQRPQAGLQGRRCARAHARAARLAPRLQVAHAGVCAGGLYLESDTDEQLLLHIPFNQAGVRRDVLGPRRWLLLAPPQRVSSCSAVKLHSLLVKSADSNGKAPRLVKLFTNRPSLGFSEAADETPVQQFELEDSALQEGATLLLKCGPAAASVVPVPAARADRGSSPADTSSSRA